MRLMLPAAVSTANCGLELVRCAEDQQFGRQANKRLLLFASLVEREKEPVLTCGGSWSLREPIFLRHANFFTVAHDSEAPRDKTIFNNPLRCTPFWSNWPINGKNPKQRE